ncbi:DegV family protein [Desulfoluna spongiiphila]|uniref:DegV family protein n=1 Tax=Desulfoluna spongiiphila TaxID=419481 RepID=UPI001254428B|nr:DegV family protein [Desulfoluna spongiiphila]VVS93541.1 degv [Desulfoluna spongiiphila]
MGQRIAIVTDSTADFPAGVTEKLGIRCVPVHVVVDGVDYLDGVSITSAQLVGRMKQGAEVVTRAAAPAAYADLYDSLLARYDRVLSFHLSAHLSNCHECAGNALALLDPADAERVTVFDTGSVSIGQAMYTLMAVRYLKKHGRIEGMKEALDASFSVGVNQVTVEDLAWLRKGGKLGALSAAFGRMLDIKPILEMKEGRLALVRKVRGMTRTLDEMVACADRLKGQGAWEVWVCHCDAGASAFYLRNQLANVLEKEVHTIHMVEAGAAISVNVGPGSCCWGMVPLG